MNPYDQFGVEFDAMGNPIHVGYHNQFMGGNGMPYGANQMGVPCNGMQQQMGMYPNQAMYGQRQRATTKKDILNYLQNMIQPSDSEQVVEFDTVKTRHICQGYKEIVLLDKQIVQVPTTNGIICVEVFFCPRCRKLLINSQSLDVY